MTRCQKRTTRTSSTKFNSISAASINPVNDFRWDAAHTDAANATRFVDRFSGELRYVAAWKKWLVWDGTRWRDDNSIGVRQRAKKYADSLWDELINISKSDANRDEFAKLRTFIKRSNQRKAICDLVDLAASDRRVVCDVDLLNANPHLLNVLNGTVNLETGCLRPHDPLDLITQLAPIKFDAGAKCPEWCKTLNLIFNGDGILIAYVRQLLGYSISGLTSEHILPICWGTGCNGKSTVWNLMAMLLGDYATLASQDLLLPTKHQHPTEIAHLYQKRFVAIGEPDQGRSLAEARVKELTGDAVVTARRMHENFWSFRPTHTFWISTNHKPAIGGTDEGIWRRIKLIHFEADLRNVTEIRKDFATWLVVNEGPGILNWLVEGYASWKQTGFVEPKVVTNMTNEYREDEDEIGQFISDCCETAKGLEIRATNLFEAYKKLGGRQSQRIFGEHIGARFSRCKPSSGNNRNKYVYRGIGLRDDTER